MILISVHKVQEFRRKESNMLHNSFLNWITQNICFIHVLSSSGGRIDDRNSIQIARRNGLFILIFSTKTEEFFMCVGVLVCLYFLQCLGWSVCVCVCWSVSVLVCVDVCELVGSVRTEIFREH